MGNLFKDMLGSGESLFRDTVPLDFDYIPKVLKYREIPQRQFAYAITPLLQERSGRNIVAYGVPGIGKTVACKHVLKELEEETDIVVPLYINCWKNNSTFKILLEMCNLLGIRLITNSKTSELFERVKALLNKKAAVFVFDEIDKLEDFDVLYMVLEDIYRKSVFLITNYKDKVMQLDERIMSRLNPEFVEFKPYTKEETRGILAERMKFAFVPSVWEDDAFSLIVDKTAQEGDIRKGLFLMREAGTIAEEKASRKVVKEHVVLAISKNQQFNVGHFDELDEELKNIFELVKKNSGMKMSDCYQKYITSGSDISYRTFARKIDDLQKAKFVIMEKVAGGNEGNTTILYLYGEKKLTEF